MTAAAAAAGVVRPTGCCSSLFCMTSSAGSRSLNNSVAPLVLPVAPSVDDFGSAAAVSTTEPSSLVHDTAVTTKENSDCIPIIASGCGGRWRPFDVTTAAHQNGNGNGRIVPKRRKQYSVIGAFYRAALQTASVTQTSSSTAQEISCSVFDTEPLPTNYHLGSSKEFRPIARRVRMTLVVAFLFPPLCALIAASVICTAGFVQLDDNMAVSDALAVNPSTIPGVVWSVLNCRPTQVTDSSTSCFDFDNGSINDSFCCRPFTALSSCMDRNTTALYAAFMNATAEHSNLFPLTYVVCCSCAPSADVHSPSTGCCCCSLFICYPLDSASSTATSNANDLSESTFTERRPNATVFPLGDTLGISAAAAGSASNYSPVSFSAGCQASTPQFSIDQSSSAAREEHIVIFAALGSLIGAAFVVAATWFFLVIVVRFHRRRLPSLIDSVDAARADLDATIADQRRSDALLCEMLPRWVAERLKVGLTVDPETFDEVTIYFSDIPGFHDVAHTCQSPVDVVSLLNSVFG